MLNHREAIWKWNLTTNPKVESVRQKVLSPGNFLKSGEEEREDEDKDESPATI